jgi:hypothetical protein
MFCQLLHIGRHQNLFLLQSSNQYNGTLPSINVVGSAGGSQESESSSGVGQSSGGDGVDGEEQEESSSSHVVCRPLCTKNDVLMHDMLPHHFNEVFY